MQFTYPGFLLALAVLAIPILIHLFYFRRYKKVYFSNVRFLKEVKEESNARRKLRNLLVLAMRLLALTMLVLAFALPFWPKDQAEAAAGNKGVSVFVDNSYSMSALSRDVPLLEKAKQRAREIVNAYQPADRFQILTHDFEGRHQRLVSQEDALSLIDEIEATPSVQNLSSVVARQKQALLSKEISNALAYIVSDFQSNITDLQDYQDSTLSLHLIPLQAVQEKNIAIDSCWFTAPVQMLNQTNPLLIQVTNYSDEAVENVRLALQHQGQEKPVGTLNIPAGTTVVDTANITLLQTGWHEAELTLTDYPITFDDHYFFTFYVPEKIEVLVINEAGPDKYLQAAFAGASVFQVTHTPSLNIDYGSLPDYELIIAHDLQTLSSGLSSELAQYIDNGGNLLVFPGEKAERESFNRFLKDLPAPELAPLEKTPQKIAYINTDEFVFQDVFENEGANLKLPATTVHYPLTAGNFRLGEPILRFRDGGTYIGKYNRGNGHLYLCATPLDPQFNDLVRNAEIFVPMLYKMAISTGTEREIAYFIGKDNNLRAEASVSQGDGVFRMKGEGQEFIPSVRNLGKAILLSLQGSIEKAGFYDLFADTEKPIQKFAFNFDRRESDLQYLSPAALAEKVGPRVQIINGSEITDLGALLTEEARGTQLWRWFIFLALLFLLLEVLVLRFWKT